MHKKKTIYLLLILISLISIIGILYGFAKTQVKEEGKQEVYMNDEASGEDALPQPEHDVVLETKITDWVAGQDGEFAVTVREITAPQRYARYRGDKQMIAASTYKLFLVHAILHEVELGRFSLQTAVGGSTIEACIESLLEISSDACAYDLGNLIGWDAVDGFIKASGYSGTILNNYTADGGFTSEDKLSTSDDQTELVWRLATGKLLNDTHTDFVTDIMKRQIWRERLAAGVPEEVQVASKPGFIYEVQNDTGIIYGAKTTYVISILSDKSDAAALADLSKLVYDHLNAQ